MDEFYVRDFSAEYVVLRAATTSSFCEKLRATPSRIAPNADIESICKGPWHDNHCKESISFDLNVFVHIHTSLKTPPTKQQMLLSLVHNEISLVYCQRWFCTNALLD